MTHMASVGQAAIAVLSCADADRKAALSREWVARWRQGELTEDAIHLAVPARPARPALPELRMPRDMPKRRKAGSLQSRIALLHALAHIELNAIDLAWDMVARFAGLVKNAEFISDWLDVADDEARHFQALAQRLRELNSFYGALPAHDGLWQSAEITSDDVLARLAIVPMVLEARGRRGNPLGASTTTSWLWPWWRLSAFILLKSASGTTQRRCQCLLSG